MDGYINELLDNVDDRYISEMCDLIINNSKKHAILKKILSYSACAACIAGIFISIIVICSTVSPKRNMIATDPVFDSEADVCTSEPIQHTQTKVVVNNLSGDDLIMDSWVDIDQEIIDEHTIYMTLGELMSYYDLQLTPDDFNNAIKEIFGVNMKFTGSNSLYFDTFGVYQDGQSIYDANSFQYFDSESNLQIDLILSKNTNSIFPSAKAGTVMERRTDNYVKSIIAGTEAYVYKTADGYIVTLNMDGTDISINAYGINENDLIKFAELLIWERN